MVDIQSVATEMRRGKKDRPRKIKTAGQKYNGLPYYIHRAAINRQQHVYTDKQQQF